MLCEEAALSGANRSVRYLPREVLDIDSAITGSLPEELRRADDREHVGGDDLSL